VIFADALIRLERGLSGALPGAAAQAILAPAPRRQWPRDFGPEDLRHAAGLLLVFPKTTITADEAHIILTVRAGTLGRHGGQVSLPGGVIDPGETIEQAALREAREEIALASGAVRVIGTLTPLDIPVSGFRLHPVVAVSQTAQTLTAADGEVARILEVAIDELLNPATLRTKERERDGVLLRIPAFHVAGEEIWGATAMVLAEFLVLLGWDRGESD
jgi:8-oxo-dGTP pyrophosphatase MutT (NUDIX family)